VKVNIILSFIKKADCFRLDVTLGRGNLRPVIKLLTALVSAMLLAGCIADIRTSALTQQPATTQQISEAARLLKKTAQVHGLRQWQQNKTVTVTARDTWRGLMKVMYPFENGAQYELSWETATFNARMKFLEGKDSGVVYGVQSWNTYVQHPDQTLTFEPDNDIHFFVPTLLYFTALPFRIYDAPVAKIIEPVIIDSLTYTRVFVTWGDSTMSPSRSYDQYILYINNKTSRIDRAYYTVREMAGGLFTGVVTYSDWKEINGIYVPFTQTISANPDKPVADNGYIHQITLQDVVFDRYPPAVLHPDTTLTPRKKKVQ